MWLHILAAAAWIGGMVFLALVLVPVLRGAEYRGIAASFIQKAGVRLRWLGWGSVGVLVVTGLLNLAHRVGWSGLADIELWQSSFGHILAVKLALAAMVALLMALHDFVLGPRATTLLKAAPASSRALRTRSAATWLARLTLIGSVIVVALSVALVRGWPW
ncbi:MAG: CopD family protein [Chloroflexi bacterium]|nr:CopD family protein [Chloroflexota bacterium]